VREVRWTGEEAERTRDGIDLRTLELTASEERGAQNAARPGRRRAASPLEARPRSGEARAEGHPSRLRGPES
jgi:hypothetical protein